MYRIVKTFLKTVKHKTHTKEQKTVKAKKIFEKLFIDISNPDKTKAFHRFLTKRKEFLSSIDEKEIIKYLDNKSLYYRDEQGIKPITKVKNKENEDIIFAFHLMSSQDFELKKLSDICDEIKVYQKAQKHNEKSNSYDLNQTSKLSDAKHKLVNFYKEYTEKIMGKDQDSDARKTKFQHLQQAFRIILGKEFVNKAIEPLFVNILSSLEISYNNFTITSVQSFNESQNKNYLIRK